MGQHQGSILGPNLFITFNPNLPFNPNCVLHLTLIYLLMTIRTVLDLLMIVISMLVSRPLKQQTFYD